MVSPPNQKSPSSQSTPYRQLISRAITQRLHSPSLDNPTPLSTNPFDAWEINERKSARESSRNQAQELGMSWEQFVQDVEAASREIHFLTPTRYQVPQDAKGENQAANLKNRGLVYEGDPIEEKSLEESRAWRDVSETHVNALRALGRARM